MELYSTQISRWIRLDSRSVVLNAPGVTKMLMTRSPVIPWSWSVNQMLSVHVQRGDEHLVFNCHGWTRRPNFQTPHLSIGTVIHPGNVGAFSLLAPNAPRHIELHVIWISACNISGSKEGDDFCKAIARNASCYVMAGTFQTTQRVRPGHVEDTAGTMWKYYDPQGDLVKRLEFIKMGPRLGFTFERI